MKLPGIGKKTAQRVILDLKDKLGVAPAASRIGGVTLDTSGMLASEGGLSWSEAKEALMTLGYTEAETDRAWHQIKGKVNPGDPVDAVMKLALQALYQM
jgi:Holliday junction DNA helicase RuvA